MRVRWNGPGSFSTSGGARRAGDVFDGDGISAATIDEHVASGAMTLLDVSPVPPLPAAVEPAAAELEPVRAAIIPPPPIAEPAPLPVAEPKAKGRKKAKK